MTWKTRKVSMQDELGYHKYLSLNLKDLILRIKYIDLTVREIYTKQENLKSSPDFLSVWFFRLFPFLGMGTGEGPETPLADCEHVRAFFLTFCALPLASGPTLVSTFWVLPNVSAGFDATATNWSKSPDLSRAPFSRPKPVELFHFRTVVRRLSRTHSQTFCIFWKLAKVYK